MDLPIKPECSWDCEGCIICEQPIPIPILNNKDNEEESWENDEFIDKLKTEMKIKEEDKLYLEKQAQKKESLEFHKYIRRKALHAKNNFYDKFYRDRNCSKLYDVWTDIDYIPLLESQCLVYFKKNVYYDNDNYKEYLFCNKADCCCKKALKVIDIKNYWIMP